MEQYKQEFIEFMVDSQVLKFGEFTIEEWKKISVFYECGWICNRFSVKKNLGNTMQKQFMTNMVMILMCCLDRHTREFHSVLLQRSHSANCMAKKFVTALTVKRKKIMVQIKEVFLEAN